MADVHRPHPLDSTVARELHDLAKAARAGNIPKINECLDAIARERGDLAEAIARGRTVAPSHPHIQRLAKAA